MHRMLYEGAKAREGTRRSCLGEETDVFRRAKTHWGVYGVEHTRPYSMNTVSTGALSHAYLS